MSRKRKSPHVPDQYAGYSLQTTRMTELLLKAPFGSNVSIEVFEDVGVENADGRRLASQNKNVQSSNPLANRAMDFWKTMANWTKAVGGNELDAKHTTFEIYLPRKIVPGELAQRFHVGKEHVRDVTIHACGWVKRYTDELLTAGKPAVIPTDQFYTELTAFTRKIDRNDILCSLAPEPTVAQIEEHLPRVFVQQLEVVGADYEDKLAAITHYFRAARDRALWGERGEVHESTFKELDTALIDVWRNLRMKILSVCGEKPACDKGKALLAECCLHRQNVQGMEVPQYFLSGCFHVLSDRLAVGWHPNYCQELSQKRKQSA